MPAVSVKKFRTSLMGQLIATSKSIVYRVGLEVVALGFHAEPTPSAIVVICEKSNDLPIFVGIAEPSLVALMITPINCFCWTMNRRRPML